MAHISESALQRRYVTLVALFSALTCAAVITINILVDPLWYFRGNQLTGKNFAFNERESKLNLLLQDPEQYDCLIFGSSRSTLLPAEAFAPYRCFNLSFSSGQIDEFVAFARYLKHAGIRPHYIVVGVDGFNFLESGRDPLTIPDCVTHLRSPSSFLRTYLSVDSLQLSMRTLMGGSQYHQYYDKNFDVIFSQDAPAFQPERSLEGGGLRRTDAEKLRKQRYVPDYAGRYAQLAAIFPDALIVAYVPPISAWRIADIAKRGVLSGYIGALYATAAHFPIFIDFSIPSPVTWRTVNTYDGSHYRPEVNRSIAPSLMAGSPQGWGIDPKALSAEAYRLSYQKALNQFAQRAVSTPLNDTR